MRVAQRYGSLVCSKEAEQFEVGGNWNLSYILLGGRIGVEYGEQEKSC